MGKSKIKLKHKRYVRNYGDPVVHELLNKYARREEYWARVERTLWMLLGISALIAILRYFIIRFLGY